jgi:hypothetical protein
MQLVLELVYVHHIPWQDVMDFRGSWDAMAAMRDAMADMTGRADSF